MLEQGQCMISWSHFWHLPVPAGGSQDGQDSGFPKTICQLLSLVDSNLSTFDPKLEALDCRKSYSSNTVRQAVEHRPRRPLSYTPERGWSKLNFLITNRLPLHETTDERNCL